MKQRGKVGWAVSLYIRAKQSEKALARNEQTLTSWLSSLNREEFEDYAAQTMELDAKENAKAA